MEDPYHCKCFFIKNIQEFENIILDCGFKDEFQEDHGQVYGYVLRVEDKLQHHIKVMPNGNIESEMELPPAYPAAHLNQEHSYPAHQETEEVLRVAEIEYEIINPIPNTCLNRKIKKPDNPTHAVDLPLQEYF
ncbi:MAG: hypothetical protein HRO68_03260 [Nitrosopumilus sp.]|nr:hypothetical protein [Nitrosopumilus sp.]